MDRGWCKDWHFSSLRHGRIKKKARKSINHGLPDLDRFLEGRERKFVTYAEGSDMYGIPYYSWLPGNGAGVTRAKSRN